MKLGVQVGIGPGHIVLERDPAPPPQRGTAPQFSAHVYCGQTASWIKMPLGTEVGLGPSHIVLDGDPAPSKRGTAPSPPIFGRCLLWPNGWMDEDVTWTKVDLGTGHIVLDGVPAVRKGGTAAPSFRPCLLWLRSPISAAAELLYKRLNRSSNQSTLCIGYGCQINALTNALSNSQVVKVI